MLVKPIYEFVLWDNCKNTCKFCWKKLHSYLKLSLQQKLAAILQLLLFINTSKYKCGSHVLLIGGEIFDDSRIADLFIYASNEVASKMLESKVDLLYINTNLLYSDDNFIDSFLDIFSKKKLFSRLKFTTSYDIVGRFSSNAYINEWNIRLQRLKAKYAELNVVVNCILTKQLCNLIVSKAFNPVKHFSDVFGYYVSVLPYIPACLEYVPTRTEVFNTFKLIEEETPGYISHYIQLLDLKLPKIVLKFNGTEFEDKSAENSQCGHCKNLSMYSTGKTCFVCDLKTVFADYL